MITRMSPEAIRQRAINIMKDGGLEICERAISKWRRGEYLNEPDAINAHAADWEATAREISKLISQLGKAAQ